MKIFSLPLSLALLCTTFASCEKKSDPPALTKTQNITAGSWKYESGGVDQDRNGTIDIQGSSILPTCALDNTITFKEDNTGIGDEGATKCNSVDPQTAPLSWNFADAEANLIMNNNIFAILNGKFKIVALSATNFSLSKDTIITAISTQPISLVVNLKH